jgi:TolB-like protein
LAGKALRYLFDDYCLDTDVRELRRGERTVPVAPQVFDLLNYLIENRDRVVTKDELIGAVWGGRVVSDSALTTRINAVRAAIGDSGGEQRIIKTLPRKGVRFIAAVREQALAAGAYHPGMDVTNKRPASLSVADKPSIAVLPFQNMSGDPEKDYFADGMVEDIITGLSRLKWLFVIARNSSFIYRGRAVDVKQVGRELGVDYVVEGSIRQSADRVRIAIQLIETESGTHVLAERYDRKLRDIFELQDEIVLSVIGAFEPGLRRAEINRTKRKRPDSLDAYDLYLRAIEKAYLMDVPNNKVVIELLESALKLEPDYAEAHGALAWQYAALNSRSQNENEKLSAIRHAKTALATNTQDATTLAYSARVVGLLDNDVDGAILTLENALVYNPSCVVAHNYLEQFKKQRGDYEASLRHAQTSLCLSPFDPHRYVAEEAISEAKYHDGAYQEALDAARRARIAGEKFMPALALIAASCVRLGRHEEARSAVSVMRQLESTVGIDRLRRWMSLSTSPQFDSLAQDLRAAGLTD